jgi:hypothetical protein
MEIDEGKAKPDHRGSEGFHLSRELDGLYAGEQVHTDNAATGGALRLPAAKTGDPI